MFKSKETFGEYVVMQRKETVFRKFAKSGKHKCTITPDRVTFKLAHNVTEEEVDLLDKFQTRIIAEDIEVGSAFRGEVRIWNGRPSAYLMTNSKKEVLTISMVEDFDGVKYSFRDKGNKK